MAGRPPINIDKVQFEKLCGLQCTLSEIAGWFNCSEDTIERWCRREYKEPFAAVYDRKREAGKISLRRAQFRLAEKSAAMAIFLGKQYLGQSDDPRKYARDDTTEDKIDRMLDALAGAITAGTDGDDDAEED